MTFLYLKSCLSDPKQLIRLIVLVICSAVAAYQLSDCFQKLRHPPISTHYGYKLNKTMEHPAITFCRNPPYKTALFAKYNLQSNANVTYSSNWKNFAYDEYSLEEFFNEVTFPMKDMIPFIGLNNVLNNCDVRETYTLSMGKCYTLLPHNDNTQWKIGGGWAIATHHDEMVRRQSSYMIVVAGYYAWIHHPKELFTENRAEGDTLLEPFYLEAGEELQVKLKLQNFDQLPSNDNPCVSKPGYSEANCLESCRHQRIADSVGYTAPFLQDNKNNPLCNNYNCMKAIISSYKSEDSGYENCNCRSSCNTTFYNPFVANRKIVDMPYSKLFVFYTSNLIAVLEETLGYDWNRFLADLGGSLGFLLGLSVLGAIGLLEQVIKVAIKSKRNNENESKVEKYPEDKNGVQNNLDVKNVDEKEFKDVEKMYVQKNYYLPDVKKDDLLTKTVNK